VRDDVVDHDVPALVGTLRAQFPLEHHNKLGFFSALAALCVFQMAIIHRRRRWLWLAATAIPVWALVLTLNRGGLVGLAAGAFTMGVLINWRVALPVTLAVALAIAVFVISPLGRDARISSQIRSVFSSQTYDDPISSMTYRFRGWQGSLRIIRDNPLFGVGYSWRNFEDIYPSYAVPEEVQNKPHAHNVWLEVAVETGLLGAIGFAVFQLGLLAASIRAHWRRPDSWLALLIGLQMIIFVVGLISYYMREQLGILIWAVFGMSLAWLALRRDAECAQEEAQA
jgi:O-antigen ligase